MSEKNQTLKAIDVLGIIVPLFIGMSFYFYHTAIRQSKIMVAQKKLLGYPLTEKENNLFLTTYAEK